jgi:hypothetical protein
MLGDYQEKDQSSNGGQPQKIAADRLQCREYSLSITNHLLTSFYSLVLSALGIPKSAALVRRDTRAMCAGSRRRAALMVVSSHSSVSSSTKLMDI